MEWAMIAIHVLLKNLAGRAKNKALETMAPGIIQG
jgi:hypothetical protein